MAETAEGDDVSLETSCSICGVTAKESETKRLVRDHNHTTGMIRGLLCDKCNNYVGLLEHDNPRRKLKRRYLQWLALFWFRIIAHLNRNTGKNYGRSRRDKWAGARELSAALKLEWE